MGAQDSTSFRCDDQKVCLKRKRSFSTEGELKALEGSGSIRSNGLVTGAPDRESDDAEGFAGEPNTKESDMKSDSGSNADNAWHIRAVRDSRTQIQSKETVQPTASSRRVSKRCCVTCNAMTGTLRGLRALFDSHGYKHLSWYDLKNSASGCALCHEIWESTEHKDWAREDDGPIVRDEIRVWAIFSELADDDIPGHPLKGHPLERRVMVGIEAHIPEDYSLLTTPPDSEGELWNFVTYEDDPASAMILGRRECKDMTCKTAAEIRRWLDTCLDNHHACPGHSDHPLPRRVLRLDSPETPRLYESGPGETGSYATLSYCWGGLHQITTTTASLEEHLRAIDATRLPKTITDAIKVCSSLGLRYLWVDALCIVQDDDGDKLDQIANMGMIYKNSMLTIVAASAEKVTDGFLGDTSFIPHEPRAQLPLYIDEETTGTIYPRMKHDAMTFSSAEPSFQRGWTYQELLLSPRAILFDARQITLKCLTDSYRPVWETYLEVKIDAPQLPTGVFGMEDENLARGSTPKSREHYIALTQDEIWETIVRDYSQRDLSSFDDRLPALAGIATELAVVWNDVYLAGFWRRTILKHLGWCRTRRTYDRDFLLQKDLFQGVVDLTRSGGGPSWSWVVAPYPVTIHKVDVPDPKLVDSHVELVSQRSPFGQVQAASVVLEARVLAVTLVMGSEIEFETGPDWDHPNHSIRLDFAEPRPRIERCRLVYLGHGRFEIVFLVVEQTEPGHYRRVGLFAKTTLAGGPKDTEDLVSATPREIIVVH